MQPSTLVGTFLLACSFLIQEGEGKTYLVETAPKIEKYAAFHDEPEIEKTAALAFHDEPEITTRRDSRPTGRLDPPGHIFPEPFTVTRPEVTPRSLPLPALMDDIFLDDGAGQQETELIDNLDGEATPWRDLETELIDNLDGEATPWRDLD